MTLFSPLPTAERLQSTQQAWQKRKDAAFEPASDASKDAAVKLGHAAKAIFAHAPSQVHQAGQVLFKGVTETKSNVVKGAATVAGTATGIAVSNLSPVIMAKLATGGGAWLGSMLGVPYAGSSAAWLYMAAFGIPTMPSWMPVAAGAVAAGAVTGAGNLIIKLHKEGNSYMIQRKLDQLLDEYTEAHCMLKHKQAELERFDNAKASKRVKKLFSRGDGEKALKKAEKRMAKANKALAESLEALFSSDPELLQSWTQSRVSGGNAETQRHELETKTLQLQALEKEHAALCEASRNAKGAWAQELHRSALVDLTGRKTRLQHEVRALAHGVDALRMLSASK